MKKRIIIIALLSVVALTVFFVLKTNNQREERKNAYRSIPDFCLQDIDNNTVTEKSLQKDIATLFLYFNPECDLCVEELSKINVQKSEFAAFQIVFFTTNTAENVKLLLDEIGFERSENMFFLLDIDGDFAAKMEVITSPTEFIYNKNGNLIKQFESIVTTETLLKYLAAE